MQKINIGIDIGSTTAKIVVVDDGKILYERYERHFSQVRAKTIELVKDARKYIADAEFGVAISGSAGLGLANAAGIPFVQEVFATGEAVKVIDPETDVVIELGGEDAKVIFFRGGMDERMNGSCAGGTGAFIDQMATLLDVGVDVLDKLSLNHKRVYPIASRCGVFAKTDIQPLLNQGASKEDIAASIFQAVVNQTISGLVQGRKIEGKVMFLGGPLYYCRGLRDRFVKTLKLTSEEAVFPEYARFAVAIGAAMYALKQDAIFTYEELITSLEHASANISSTTHLSPLFNNREEYDLFTARHNKTTVENINPISYNGKAYLGIDCGSTTTKLVLITENDEILYTYYNSNKGNPVQIVKEQLDVIYSLCNDRVEIAGSAVTGYGEELIKNAFSVDLGIVETMAHYSAAKHFNPDVDFILDIGGQDIKCFKIKNNAIDSIMLNEACSSGCGSFIETFAKSMGYEVEAFSKLGLFGKSPVDLGSRCTVFMNSSVKQAQKEGASVEDISAGLSMSVVKNAIYKVIRASSVEELGYNIVVQGGTFLNDAVLRSFEIELGHNVIRPTIAGLMGAYGAALRAKSANIKKSTLITKSEMKSFTYTSKSAVCRGCTNNCHLTINTFANNKRFVSGNQCEVGLGMSLDKVETVPNLYTFKRDYITSLPECNGSRGTIGLPLALGTYELAPLWHGLFTSLGYKVVLSDMSTKKTYDKGQFTIPSDTVCYPAKIMHGHIQELIERDVDAIFYPCLTYNVDEGAADNHYNCPIVAYYSELLIGNMESLQKTKFLYPYININDKKELVRGMNEYLNNNLGTFTRREIKQAVDNAFEAYDKFISNVKVEGIRAIEYARKNNKRIMILAGRPYHIDTEIGHGIDKLANTLGFVVVSEDSMFYLEESRSVNVLNQWTYHARLYRAAHYAVNHPDTELVQLVSFGCGLDAITTDEVRSILEDGGKLYTQIKIDDITNLGAVRIRLRSLIGALDERN